MNRVQLLVFRFYEQHKLRNWFYTIAFAIFVPVGYHFADLAWRYGSWYDKPLAVIAGLFIGIATIVTLMRIWHVTPKHIVTTPTPQPVVAPLPERSMGDEMMAAARRRAARNRDIAMHAAALGSSTGKHWH
jgi:hypothetical protein